jgi:hypothetical protein
VPPRKTILAAGSSYQLYRNPQRTNYTSLYEFTENIHDYCPFAEKSGEIAN